MKNYLKLPIAWGLLLFAAAGLLTAATPKAARADGATYASNKKQYKVGILLIASSADADLDGNISPAEAARGPENPDPFVFYIADISKLKPANWDIINPLAPSTVSTDVFQRWSASGGRDPGNPYQLGQRVTKNMAAYWEVSLSDSSVADLLKFDLLFITNHRTVRFTPAEREKLRKLVDAGGVVWIEDCGNMRIDGKSPFFLQDLQFTNTGSGTGGPSVNIPTHPILNTPYQLSLQEIANLGDKNYADYAMTSQTTPGQAPNPETLLNIVGNRGANGLPYIAAGNYGSGAVIATSSDSGCDINDYAGGSNSGSGGNSGAFCGPNTDTAHAEDLKFVYNVIAWGGANNTYRRNNRRTASSFETVGAPLVTGFDFSNAGSVYGRTGDVVDSKSAPLIIKGIAFVSGASGGTATVRTYDVNPYRDLDGDGNPDEGRPDLALGLPYDEIWRYSGGAAGSVQPSTPIYASFSVRGAGGVGTTPYERVYVTLPDGGLAMFNAFPLDSAGRLSATPSVQVIASATGGAYDVGATNGVAPAPVFIENRIYQVEPNGLLRCLDAATGTVLWTSFATAPTDRQILPAATPTSGYVQQTAATSFAQASGGTTNDLTLYMPVEEIRTNGGRPGLVYPYWLGTRNEVQTWAGGPDGELGLVNTRIAGGPGGPSKGQYYMAAGAYASTSFIPATVTVYSATYDPADKTVLVATAKDNLAAGVISPYFTGAVVDENGQIQLTIKAGSPFNPKRSEIADVLVSVDYDVVYVPGGSGSTPPPNYSDIGARSNGRLGFNGSYAGRINTPAFSPDDILFYDVDQAHHTNTGGTIIEDTQRMAGVFAATEQEGNATTILRWHMDFFGDGPGSNASGTFIPITQSSYKTATYPAGLTYVQQALVRDVDSQQIVDLAPLRNYLVFDTNWPGNAGGNQNAEKIQTTVAGATGNVLADDYETLANTRVVGTPIVTNDGLTYVLANAYSLANDPAKPTAIPNNAVPNMNVLMAFKTNPEIILHTKQAYNDTQGVQVTQADVLSDPNNPATVGNSAVRVNGNGIGAQFTLDGDRSTIVITNFATANRTFSAAQSFVVRYTPRGATAPVTEVITPTPGGTTSGDTSNANPGGFTPLQWYYVLPGQAQSSPTLIGDNIYYTVKRNGKSYLVAVDADPASQDPSVRLGFGDPVQNVVANLTVGATTAPTTTNHVRMASLVSAQGNVLLVAPPVGAENTLIINSSVTTPSGPVASANTSPLGTFAFSNGLTLISQNTGLIEARPDGSVTWKLDTTIAQTTVGGKQVTFDRNGQPTNVADNGATSVARVPLAHPTAVRKINDSDFLIADTGGNRAVRVDRAGNVLWSLSTLTDPYAILSSGDSLTLSGPTDVQYYTAPTLNGSGTPIGYSIHYLVADAGNFRIVEVADYYDTDGKPVDAPGVSGTAGQHVVVWTTRTTSEQSRKLRFQSIQRKIGVAPQGSVGAGSFGFPYLVAVVGNTSITGGASTPSADGTGGALVSLNYSPYNTPIFLRDPTSGALTATPTYWQANASARTSEPVGNGLLVSSRDTLTLSFNNVLTKKRIGRPTYFQQLTLPDTTGNGTRTLYLICDGDGVYAVENSGGSLLVRWMFTQDDYNYMNGVDTRNGNVIRSADERLAFDAIQPYSAGQILNATYLSELPRFSPTSVKLLPSGNFLISNSYAGRSSLFDGGRFVGEVFEVAPFGVSVTAPIVAGINDTTYRGGNFDLFAVPALNKVAVRDNTAAKGVLLHVNRQVMGNPTGNTGLLEQPAYSDRP